jgi:AraC-like DNA-binding protein
MRETPGRASIPPVATVLEPRERAEVDRIGAGLYRAVHRERVADVIVDLRQRRVSAVVLSTARCTGEELVRTMRVVRDFPGIPTLALLSQHGRSAPEDLLAVGNCGIRHIIDVRTPAGWKNLRRVIASMAANEGNDEAVARVLDDVGGPEGDMAAFMLALFDGYSSPRTVRQLAAVLGVLASTLVSRFYRAGLPAPKRYLAFAGLVRAARLFENPGLSIADVANHLGHSSPQSFARHIRTYSGVSAGEFRRRYSGNAMLQRFRDELVAPHRAQLRALSPVVERPRRPRTPRAKDKPAGDAT